MIARYLGSKQSVLPALLGEVGRYCQPGDHVVDAFSGSLAVSLGLKRAGYRVTANDVNLFSAVLADAYLLPEAPPDPDIAALGVRRQDVVLPGRQIVAALLGKPGYAFLANPAWRQGYETWTGLQDRLQTVETADLPSSFQRTDFFDNYSEEGRYSAYTSSRGRSGRRRFLSSANARRLDLILNQLRAWRQGASIDSHTHALLLATVLRAVERVANTQGTYHDFPRDTWDPRALQPLTLEPPPLDDTLGGSGGHKAGREEDSLQFMKGVNRSTLLYLDPPYNFRQYSAYYFLPNVICRYPDMLDPEAYFSKITYVRGQNPDDDFSSSFCKAASFIGDLRKLIERSRTGAVLISYFNGRNHWSKFDVGPSDTGRNLLESLLTGPGFEPGSLRVEAVPRTNYASYGGFKARTVDELLLSATVQTDQRGSTDRSDDGLRPVA